MASVEQKEAEDLNRIDAALDDTSSESEDDAPAPRRTACDTVSNLADNRLVRLLAAPLSLFGRRGDGAAQAARLEAEAELRRRAEARAEDLERSLESAHAVARELEAQLATERGRRRNETHRAEEAEGLVQLSHLCGWMDDTPLSPLNQRLMPSAAAASPDTEAHRRNFLPRWAPRVGNQEAFHRELAADEALHRQRVAELAEQRRVLQAAEFDGGCWPRQRLFV